VIKRILLFCLLAVLVCLPALPGRAQEPVNLSTLDVSLWPEYDQPSLLVIYKAQIAPEVSLPAEITFLIPSQAGKPFALAVGPNADSVADVTYELQPAGEWVQVSFIATSPAIWLEYYDPRLEKEGDQRTVSYTWPGDYAVDSLAVAVQHPIGSSNFSVTPPASDQMQDEDGFLYDVINQGALPAGSSFTVTASYQKNSDELSATNLPIQPSAPVTAPTTARVNLGQALPWILGILGVALIAGGGIWYWQSGKQSSTDKSRRRRRTARPKGADEALPEEEVYCHNCGKRASAGDRFCRTCGTKLRIE
jgi:zinc-ribbon domain